MNELRMEGFGCSSGPAGNLADLFSLLSYRSGWPEQKKKKSTLLQQDVKIQLLTTSTITVSCKDPNIAAVT